MRSNYLLPVLLSALSAVTLGATSIGCGDSSSGSSGSGGSGSSSSSSSTGSVGGGGSGGGVISVDDDGNTGCDTAAMFDLSGDDFPGTLKPVDVDKDYFKVTVKKGQAIYVGTTAKPDTDPYGDPYPDTVITIYSEDGKTQIARNDDMSGSNNSELIHLVPADATYCVEIADCYAAFGPDLCGDPAAITIFDYNIFAFEVNPNSPISSVDKEPNDTAGAATPMTIASYKDANNAIAGYQTLGWGTFSSATDKDIFGFKVANDFPVDPKGRSSCFFQFYELGTEGNGSSATTGLIANVATKANPSSILAQVDLGVSDLTFGYVQMPSISMPCSMGTDYVLSLARAQGEAAGANDFYVYSMVEAGSNRIEKEPNNAAAEKLDLSQTDDKTGWVAGIGGDISTTGPGGDTDVFSAALPAGKWLASALCYAERDGSGLRGLQVALTDNADNPLVHGSGTEGADHLAFADNALVPDAATEVKMTVTAESQDPNVSSKYYFCQLALLPQ